MSARVLDQLQEQLRPETAAIAAVAIVSVTLLAAWLYLYRPTLAEYRRLGLPALPALVAEGADEATRSAAIAQAERDLAELQRVLQGEAAGVDPSELEAWIIRRLDAVAVRHDVLLERVDPGAPGAVMVFDELPYDVSVSGEYFALFEWLREVERELRPMVVKRFELQADAEAGVKMMLRLVSYRPAAEGAS